VSCACDSDVVVKGSASDERYPAWGSGIEKKMRCVSDSDADQQRGRKAPQQRVSFCLGPIRTIGIVRVSHALPLIAAGSTHCLPRAERGENQRAASDDTVKNTSVVRRKGGFEHIRSCAADYATDRSHEGI